MNPTVVLGTPELQFPIHQVSPIGCLLLLPHSPVCFQGFLGSPSSSPACTQGTVLGSDSGGTRTETEGTNFDNSWSNNTMETSVLKTETDLDIYTHTHTYTNGNISKMYC